MMARHHSQLSRSWQTGCVLVFGALFAYLVFLGVSLMWTSVVIARKLMSGVSVFFPGLQARVVIPEPLGQSDSWEASGRLNEHGAFGRPKTAGRAYQALAGCKPKKHESVPSHAALGQF